MTITATPSEISYAGNGVTTVFPINYVFDTSADLKVIRTDSSGNPVVLSSGFSVSGGGGSTGTLTMLVAPPSGSTLTILDNPDRTQTADYIANDDFAADAHERALDRGVRISKRIYQLLLKCVRVDDGDPSAGSGTLLGSVQARKGKYLFFNAITGAIEYAVALATTALSQSIIAQLLNPQTLTEAAAGATPVNYWYPAGCPDRFATNTSPGTTDMTTAVQTAINSCDRYIGTPGSIYGVTSVTFPLNGPHHINFNGSVIRGIASAATNCVVKWEFEGTTVIDYRVDGNFSQKYKCGTWWYNAVSSSQYNRIFGMRHTYFGGVQTSSGVTVRAMIYGELVGSSSTSFAQSENQIYGWSTRGCQNPFYGNHNNGVLFFSNPIFAAVAEDWPGGTSTPSAPWSAANSRGLENVAGSLIMQGGELQIATTGTVIAAELQGVFWTDSFIEAACPIKITGDSVRFSGGRFFQAVQAPCFTIASGVTGVLAIDNWYATRPATTGSFDNSPMIDASANASAFEVVLSDTESFEYRWVCVGVDVRLVKLGALTTVRYKNHRMSMTAADANVFILNTNPTDSLLEGLGFDRLGYTTTGWTLTNFFGAGTTMTVTTVAGPTGYLASQITLHATGSAQASFGDPTSLATLKASSLHVRPGELFWMQAWCNISAGTTGSLVVDFYDLTGAAVSVTTVADQTVIGTAAWKFIEAPVVVPATAAYACLGVRANVSDIRVTDLRPRRA